MLMGLPRPILIKRINNELDSCSRYLKTEIPPIPDGFGRFPVEIDIALRNVPGYAKYSDGVRPLNDHRCKLILSEEYGFRRPEVRWQTSIFHPNIMMPEDGGYVCLKAADAWEFGSTLLSFIKSIEQLVISPNPKSPFGTDTCMEASKYFIENRSKIEISVSYGDR